MVYEHRNYLPSVGVFILLAALLTRAVGALRSTAALRPQLLQITVLAACATLLLLRVVSWADPLRLSAVNAANHPQSSRSQFFLAQSQLRAYQSGLEEGAESPGNHLLLARHHFELMHQNNPRDIAAIVMLYYLDQHHLPQLQQYQDWFAILEELARDRPLQASDITALDTLVDCYIADACGDEGARLLALFDVLQARYADRIDLALMRYRLLKKAGAPLVERLALLDELQSRSPADVRTYQNLLAEYVAAGDVSGQYETLKEWLRHDPGRRQLGAIRRLFAEPGKTSAVGEQ
jgi:protein O-mannosyl-transferase